MHNSIVPSLRHLLTAFALASFLGAIPAHARITKIVIDEKISPAFCKDADALIAAAAASAVLK